MPLTNTSPLPSTARFVNPVRLPLPMDLVQSTVPFDLNLSMSQKPVLLPETYTLPAESTPTPSPRSAAAVPQRLAQRNVPPEFNLVMNPSCSPLDTSVWPPKSAEL